jgi:hypothetical protein
MGVEKINKIEDRKNEMIDQIKSLINNSYPPMLGYKVEYFIGEGEDTQRTMLVFDMSTRAFGDLYKKMVYIRPPKTVNDYENDFVGKVLTDFILLGTTFLTNTVMASKAAKREDSDAVLKHPFSKGSLNNVTLN